MHSIDIGETDPVGNAYICPEGMDRKEGEGITPERRGE